MQAEQRFAALLERFAGHPGVQLPDPSRRAGFGSEALTVNGSIFAMLSGDRLVVKLPRERVDALIERSAGTAFDAGKGRPMREWLTVAAGNEEVWPVLAAEALDFVGSRSRRR